MSETPESEEPEGSKKGFFRTMSASHWVELAIFVVVGIALLIAAIGWLTA